MQYQQQRGSYPGRREQRAPLLPPNYLANGYFDSDGNLLPEVILDWARAIAYGLYEGRMMTAQLRRFFAEVRRIELMLRRGANFKRVQAEILKLPGYADDAVKKNKAPSLFQRFIEQNIKWAGYGEREFLVGFVNHFECVVAFFPKTHD